MMGDRLLNFHNPLPSPRSGRRRRRRVRATAKRPNKKYEVENRESANALTSIPEIQRIKERLVLRENRSRGVSCDVAIRDIYFLSPPPNPMDGSRTNFTLESRVVRFRGSERLFFFFFFSPRARNLRVLLR